METYIAQLLEDLQEGSRQLPPAPFLTGDPDYLSLDYIEEWETAPYHPFGTVMGIEGVVFPPDERLSDEQVERLSEAILALWASRNVFADLPDELPWRVAYRLLVQRWAGEPIQFLAQGMNCHLEFCDYEPENCPFGLAYCQCK